MTRKKQRVPQHIMEDESYGIIKRQIPKHWVIREFNRPDYGIDLVIELFEIVDENIAETLGEFIYVQVKSVKELESKFEKIFEVGNVAKGAWIENRKKYANIEVIKYPFDTNSIYTFQSLGGSVSILLFIVDIKNEEVYFISINDYIDKIVLPKTPNYTEQSSLSITIPVLNKLSNQNITNNALKFYGKRAKLLALFSKVSYQKNEIGHLFGFKTYPVWTYRDEIEKDKKYEKEEIRTQLLYFISQIEELDIWKHNEWAALPEVKKDIVIVKDLLLQDQIEWNEIKNKVIILWHELTNLGTMYEDLCREWYLPKIIGLMTSYPTTPEIIDKK
jgi:hypothetical protein